MTSAAGALPTNRWARCWPGVRYWPGVRPLLIGTISVVDDDLADDVALAKRGQGVIDVIRGSTNADTFTTAARAGYLINAGVVRVGPIAGFNYTHGVIGAYTESGDILLTMMVDRQTINALTGDAGLQLRLPFVAGTALYSPFINLTAEQDFAGSGRNVTTTLVTAPLLPILTPVSAHDRTYGKVAAGIGASIAGNISATNVATTFAREGGNDFAVSGGIKAVF